MKKGIARSEVLQDVPLKDFTSLRVGGNAKILYRPDSLDDLQNFLKLTPKDLPVMWLGLGSNSLIRDNGFNGAVILTQNNFNEISLKDNNLISASAGVPCAQMARFSARNNLSGGEFWAGIPGTMGGALRMNAGCFNGQTWDYVVDVTTINRFGEVKTRPKDDFQISYRSVSGLQEDEWFIGATFRLKQGTKDESLKVIKDLLEKRAQTQPTSEYNCGSIFKNPENNYAAQLIETSGLKGIMIGNAEVSLKHANFIINKQGQAKAKDIESLILYVRDTVEKNTGIKLDMEVKIIGED